MPDPLVTPRGIVVPAAALTLRLTRASGPGGQHVNTSATRVELVCDLRTAELPPHLRDRLVRRLGATVRVVASRHRSQARNRDEAYRRLAERIDEAAEVVPPRRPTRPGRAAARRRVEAKRRLGEKKRRRGWRPSADD